jgi:hypothetical protein
LLEPQRTNHYHQSEYFSTGTRVVIANNSTTSPENVNNATSVIATSVNGSHEVTLSPIISIANTNPRTFSLYAKYNGNHLILNVAGSSTAWTACVFDLQNGVAKTPQNNGSQSACTADIEDAGNGWYRCSVTYTPYASGGFLHLISLTDDIDATLVAYGADEYVGDDVSGIYIYGAQVEEGSYATSYIPTYGSAVTRAYENQDATGLSTSVFNNDDLTLFYDFDYNADGREGSTTAYRIFSGTSQLGIKGRSGSSRSVEIYSSGSFSGSIVFNNIANSSRIKVALRITNGTCELFFNGAKDTETIDVSGAAPYTWGQITMLASSSLNTSLNQCLGFPTALTDQELIDLTTL